jgi:hypothetical protein
MGGAVGLTFCQLNPVAEILPLYANLKNEENPHEYEKSEGGESQKTAEFPSWPARHCSSERRH